MTPDFDVKRWHKIRIPKGTKYRTTHPKKDGDQYTKRTYVVQTHTSSGPYTDRVTWAGSGGYWCWTEKINVEIYDEEES